MKLLLNQPSGGELAVLGAGNASDLDLALLARHFTKVHLFDLDGDALERARAREPESVRERLVLHGNVDLSGLMAELDAWGDAFPAPGELGRAAVATARELVRRLGGPFQVVLSACVLSQLGAPFRRAWVAPASTWANVLSAITAVHLASLSSLVAPGGHGALIFDARSSNERYGTDPEKLRAELESPGLAARVRSARLSEPWHWDLGNGAQLVYALEFEHA